MKDLNNVNDWSDIQEHQKIGEILMQCGKLSLQNLGIALDVQKIKNIQIGDILVDINVISRDELNKALWLQNEIDKTIGENNAV